MPSSTPFSTKPIEAGESTQHAKRCHWLKVILLSLGAVLVSIGWATSSPPGASPDESAHIIYAWGTVTGQTLPSNVREDIRGDDVALTTVTVPDSLNERPPQECYAFKSEAPACATPAMDFSGETDRTTYMTRYPPLYYFLIGVPLWLSLNVGFSGATSLIVARVFSSLLSLAVLSLATASIGRRFGSAPSAIAACVALTPQFLFLSASINPNGFEIASSFATAAFVCSCFYDAAHSNRIERSTAIGLAVSSLFLGLSRPASLVWLLPMLALLFLKTDGTPVWRRLSGIQLFWVLTSVALSVICFVYMNSARGGGIDDHDTGNWSEINPITRLILVGLRFGQLVINGYGLLGWLDTEVPTLFFIVWIVACAFAIGRAFTNQDHPPLLKARWAIAVFLVFITAVAAQSYLAGFGWQGRYFSACIAAFVPLLLPTMTSGSRSDPGINRTAVVLLVITATLNFAALVWNLGRYLYGMLTLQIRFQALPIPHLPQEWTPLIGTFTPLVLGLLGTLVATTTIVSSLRQKQQSPVSNECAAYPGSGNG